MAACHPAHYKDGSSAYGRIAIRHHGNHCNRCGYKEHIEILRTHHKDRNSENNLPDNLERLCPNCHETEHFLAGDGVYTGHKRH
jgi:5-methylcytosine-specific restriction endonuclease McrA